MGMTLLWAGWSSEEERNQSGRILKDKQKTLSHGLVSSSHMRKVISAGEWQAWTAAVSLLLGHISVA